MFDIMEISEQVYEVGTPYKHPLGQISTVIVMSVNIREYNPPHIPTLRKSLLASARQKMYAI